MPKVPRYDEQVREAAIPGARSNIEAPAAVFGGGPAAAGAVQETRGLAKDVATFANEQREAADTLVVQNADLETAKEKLRLLKDPKIGALNVRGQETLGLPDSVGENFEKYTQGVKERLTSGQRASYDRLLVSHKRDINETLQTHIFGEMRKFDETTTAARLETAKEEAALLFNDPKAISENIAAQHDILRKRANRDDLSGQAVPPEELARQLADATSKTHSAVMSRLLTANQDHLAREYYATNKDSLTQDDDKRISAALRAGTILGESQRQAGEIMGKHKDEKAALDSAREIKDPDIQKATIDEIKTRFAEDKRIERQAAEQALQEAANIVEQAKDARAVPPPLWAQLSVGERHALETRSRQLREGVEPVTDWPEYYDLKTLASSEATRPAFLRENLLLRRGQFADVEFKELVGLQASLRQGGDEASRKALDGFRTKNQIVNDALNSADIDPTPKPGSKDSEKVAIFRNLVEDEVRQIQRATGKEATNDAVQKVVDQLLIKTTKRWFRADDRAFESMATKKSDVPRQAMLKIEDALKRQGVPVSDDNIVEAYNFTIRQKLSGR